MMCDYKDNTFFIYMQIFGKLFSEKSKKVFDKRAFRRYNIPA
jgi:hypothetical protein